MPRLKIVSALELKVPPPALALVFAVAMWFTSAQLPSLAFALPWHVALAITFTSAGIILVLAGVVVFRKAKTTINPTKPGATSAMVTSGVYRLSRNPMYVGLFFVLVGWAAFLSHTLALFFLPLFVAYMNRFQIVPEERALSSKFGKEYAAYKQSARRWL